MNKKSTFSPKHLEYLKNQNKHKTYILIAQLGALVVFLAIWEILARLKLINAFLYSSPSRIFITFLDMLSKNQLLPHIWASTSETLIGFFISTVLGTAVAVALWWSPNANKVMMPYIVVLNSLPKIALGPIIIVWMGVGKAAIITMSVLISVVITTINMLTAFNSTSPDKILLLKTMNANKRQIFTKLVLPSNLINFVSTLKINIGMAWVGTIMGEYLVSQEGLGYLITYGGQVFKLDLVMTCVVVLAALAALMYLIIALIEKKMSRYKS